MYSAKKIDGKKLYQLAREGKIVERKAVPVTLKDIQVLSVTDNKARFLVTCSAGTYIRTLCVDIGKKLGCEACMSSLTRVMAGGFSKEQALTLEKIKELADKNEMDGPVFKIKEDPRITKIGKFLRKTGIDEILQLVNVLKGDMSLVGPRPPLPEEVSEYDDYQKLRLVVTPGLTCIWQTTKERNDVSFEEWVNMDIDYIEHRTMLLDIKMIFKTVAVMFGRDGR